jgi:Pregnancy-associated plasma protein-A
MKKCFSYYFLLLFIVSFLPATLKAQDEEALCGWTIALNEGEPEPTGNPEDQCFDVAAVLESCTPVYIRFNVHFFTDTDCKGSVQIINSSQRSAYKIAENLINNANHTLANNQIQWQSPGAVQVCNPIRYVLSGVYIHCLSDAVGGSHTAALHYDWSVHEDTEINVYIANFPGAATGIGFPTYASIDWVEAGNLNHEIGHVFGLTHTFDPTENCSDTPRVIHNWDKNCDGDLTDPGEQVLQCWSYIDADMLPGQAGFRDANNNGAHDCNEMLPCTPSPCCDWLYIDNNFMSYNAYKSSYTKCQLSKMLTDLSEHDCSYVEKIGGCPPPHAFITQTPSDILNTDYCIECIVLEASFNETQHLLEIYSISNGVLAYSSGWKNSPVDNFCFTTKKSDAGHFLKPNTEYRVVLAVKNECGDEDDAEYVFTTPSPKCTLEGISIGVEEQMLLRPNPTALTIQVHFNADSDERFVFMVVDNLSGRKTIVQQNYVAYNGENQIDISVIDLNTGSYTLICIGEHHLYQSRFVKF